MPNTSCSASSNAAVHLADSSGRLKALVFGREGNIRTLVFVSCETRERESDYFCRFVLCLVLCLIKNLLYAISMYTGAI